MTGALSRRPDNFVSSAALAFSSSTSVSWSSAEVKQIDTPSFEARDEHWRRTKFLGFSETIARRARVVPAAGKPKSGAVDELLFLVIHRRPKPAFRYNSANRPVAGQGAKRTFARFRRWVHR